MLQKNLAVQIHGDDYDGICHAGETGELGKFQTAPGRLQAGADFKGDILHAADKIGIGARFGIEEEISGQPLEVRFLAEISLEVLDIVIYLPERNLPIAHHSNG